MSMYYRRHELQWRVAFLFCGCIISGAFSGLLAYAIAHMEGVAGYSSWRWIFILEGLLSVLVGASAFLLGEMNHHTCLQTQTYNSFSSA